LELEVNLLDIVEEWEKLLFFFCLRSNFFFDLIILNKGIDMIGTWLDADYLEFSIVILDF